jgi:hypothetical protein
METRSISLAERIHAWLQCRCPQDGIFFHGAFHDSGLAAGYCKAYLTIDDRPRAQATIAAAIINANRRH